MNNSLYEKLKAKGHDMSWYEKSKSLTPENKRPIPLTDDHCGLLSIYWLDEIGKLFTVKSDGEPYMQVRATGNKSKTARYLCACCNKQFKTFKEASEHYAKEDIAEANNQNPS